MKTSLLYTALLFFIVQLGHAQKEIKAVPISEGSKLSIEAKAETVNNVTFTITSTVSLEGYDIEKKFPHKMKIAPFNQKTFKDNLLEFFYVLEKYQTENETLKKLLEALNDTSSDPEFDDARINAINNVFKDEMKLKVFEDKSITLEGIKNYVTDLTDDKKEKLKTAIQEILKSKKSDLLDNQLNKAISLLRTKATKDDSYEMKVQLDDRINTLYRYFNDQIVLLFEYDTEPVAGTLYYNSKIEGIQYFTNRRYELLFQNKKRNFHRLIRNLAEMEMPKDDLAEKNEESLLKLINSDSIRNVAREEVSFQINRTKERLANAYLFQDTFDSIVSAQSENAYYKTITQYDAKKVLDESLYNWGDYDLQEDKVKNTISKFSQNQTESLRIKQEIEDDLYKNLITEEKNRIKKDPLNLLRREAIFEYFKKSSDGNLQYLKSTGKFIEDYRELIFNFRKFNRNKRNQIIYENILNYENKEIYLQICNCVTNTEILRTRKIESNNRIVFFRNLNKIVSAVDDYRSKVGRDSTKYSQSKEYLSTNFENVISRNRQLDTLRSKSFEEKLDFFRGSSMKTEISYFDAAKSDFDISSKRLKNSQDENKKLVTRIEELVGDLKNLKLAEDFYLDLKEPKYVSLQRVLQDYDSNAFIDFVFEEFESERIQLLLKKEKDSNGILEGSLNQGLEKIEQLLKKTPLWNFTPETIELDFNEGFIEHITMFGKITGISTNDEQPDFCDERLIGLPGENNGWKNNIDRSIKFVNDFPYGFSSSKDYDDFKKYKLAVYNGRHREFQVEIEKIFPNYVQKLANNRLDFSPKNGVITLRKEDMKSDKNNSIELKKETSSKLFNFSVYTDFVGFQDNPNGLVQVEFSKLIPLYTKRKTNEFWRRYLGQGYNFGRFNYILPQFRWSRLDSGDEKENLPLSYQTVFEGGVESQVPFVTTLNLLRYENISVGADINLVSFDFPTSKFRFELNAGARYGRTKVLDSAGEPIQITEDSTNVRATFDVNTWRYYPEFVFRLRPEERYGANLSWRPIRFNTVTTDFSTISSEEQFRRDLTDNPQWLHQMEINAHYSPTGRRENRFFFRYRYTNNANWETNGFSEIHLGYSLSLRVNNKE